MFKDLAARRHASRVVATGRKAPLVDDSVSTCGTTTASLLIRRLAAVPLVWRRMLHGWPGYRSRDLVRLAFLSALKGEVDQRAWPVAADAYFASHHHPATSLGVELPDDAGVIVGNVRGPAEADVDVVVSLCRVGSGYVKAPAEGVEVWLIDDPSPEANENLAFIAQDTADAIATWRRNGERVFLHCAHAVSRTPFIAAAYLARLLGITGRQALERVREVLPAARPNIAFVETLEAIND